MYAAAIKIVLSVAQLIYFCKRNVDSFQFSRARKLENANFFNEIQYSLCIHQSPNQGIKKASPTERGRHLTIQ